MSAERLVEIRERLEAATPGPWFAQFNGHYHDIQVGPDRAAPSFAYAMRNPHDPRTAGEAREAANAALIAHAPEDIRYLLDRVEKLERVREAAQKLGADSERMRDLADWIQREHGPIGWVSQLRIWANDLRALDGDSRKEAA